MSEESSRSPIHYSIVALLIVLPFLANIFCGCRSPDGGPVVHVLRPVDDPLVLPYRFQLDYSHVGPQPTLIIPTDFDGDGRLESYQVQTGRHIAEGMSSILIYDCVDCGNVVEQYNYDNTRITDSDAFDVDGDGLKEIIVLFETLDTLFVEIIDFREGRVFHSVLSTGTDLNGDGIWDANGYVVGCADFTGDGTPDLLLAVDVGYDLYTRELVCLDWTAGKRVWSYEVAGIVTHDRFLITTDPVSEEIRLVVGVASKGNAAVANGMDDLHAYLVCLDGRGQEVWRREVGGVFTNPVPAWIHFDQDSLPEILFSSSVRVDSTPQSDPVRTDYQWSVVVCNLAGRTIDSLAMPADHRYRNLRVMDPGLDGRPSVMFNSSDDTVHIFNQQLQEKMLLTYSARIEIRGFYDLIGRSENQILVSTTDGKVWLLDQECVPLAQIAEGLSPTECQVIPRGEGGGLQLMMRDVGNRENYIYRVVPTPWYTIFYRNPLLAVAAGVIPLIIILGVIGVAMVRVRQKNVVIIRQKDALAQALDELHAAQERLLEAEKSQLTHDIAGGVAHEIRNALDPAVQCLSTLQDELPESDERVSAMLDMSRRSVSRALRMTRMVKELSDLSGANSGASVQVAAVINDVLARLQQRISALDIEVTTEYPDQLKIGCSADHAGILLGNLIGNAIDATEGTAERKLRITGLQKDGEVTIRVADSGPGVTEHDQTRVFNAFFSTKPSTGMGLGLTLCKRIITMYRGTLTLDTQVATGATFVVTLPSGEPEGET